MQATSATQVDVEIVLNVRADLRASGWILAASDSLQSLDGAASASLKRTRTVVVLETVHWQRNQVRRELLRFGFQAAGHGRRNSSSPWSSPPGF